MPSHPTVLQSAKLLPHLSETRPEVKKTKVRQWLKFGMVMVNGKSITQFDHPLKPGDVVTIQSERAARTASALPSSIKILFEDEHLMVIEKPEGLLSIATESEKKDTVYAHLTNYVRGGLELGRERVWIVHRLDRETSGLMVFARTEAAKRTLQENWQDAEKRYLAVAEGAPEKDEGLLHSYLDESHPGKVFSTTASDQTREAKTHFQVLKRRADRSLIELTLETGRRHQIRVQLSDIGCPIVGDEKYASRTNPAKRLGLHACHLEFPHPETGEPLSFDSPLPHALAKLV